MKMHRALPVAPMSFSSQGNHSVRHRILAVFAVFHPVDHPGANRPGLIGDKPPHFKHSTAS
jgi:hypothetical protein